jgi:kumamolisin
MNVLRNGCAGLLATMMVAPAMAKPITAMISLNERVSMQELARQVRDPLSPRYGHFFSPQEIRDLAAPSARDYKEVVDQLRHEGFKIKTQSATHLWISVEAEKDLFENVFATQLVVNGSRHQQLYAASVPSRLSAVSGIFGLDSTRQSHPKFIKMSRPQAKPGGIQAADIKAVYSFNPIYSAGVTGKNQDIAIATYDGFNITDVNYYYKYMNLGAKVDQVIFNGTPAYSEGSAGETQLDSEFSGMIAPSARVHVFASASNSDVGEAQMFTAILDDNRSKIVNYSWGGCETTLSSQHKIEMEKIFARAVAQGVNILVASGDSGSDSCQDGTVAGDWPSVSENVVAVGGTTLRVSRGQGTETAWNGSGGGISSLIDLPQWQTALGAPYVKRSYPDVSFNADPNSGQAVYIHENGTAGWVVIGGTSMAAPQWAGFLALVGEARQKLSKAPLGYMSPMLYSMTDSQRTATMTDITSGSNGAYTAAVGWDAVTGYGSMKADSLLSYLSGL